MGSRWAGTVGGPSAGRESGWTESLGRAVYGRSVREHAGIYDSAHASPAKRLQAASL
ncbi:MAG TPA: hypothetical protein H9668_05615 [Firmicutes bacterium]|nr:hypothetical protein [Bacillota bacterium]